MSVKISKTIPSRSSLASSDDGLEKLLNPRHSKRHHACGRNTKKIKQGWATARAAASDRCSYRWWWWEEWSRNACTSWPSWESMSATPWAFCSSQLPLTSPSLLFFFPPLSSNWGQAPPRPQPPLRCPSTELSLKFLPHPTGPSKSQIFDSLFVVHFRSNARERDEMQFSPTF